MIASSLQKWYSGLVREPGDEASTSYHLQYTAYPLLKVASRAGQDQLTGFIQPQTTDDCTVHCVPNGAHVGTWFTYRTKYP